MPQAHVALRELVWPGMFLRLRGVPERLAAQDGALQRPGLRVACGALRPEPPVRRPPRRLRRQAAWNVGRLTELAWRAVAWAVARGGAEVRAAVIDAFAASEEVLTSFASGAAASSELAAHGRPGATEVAAVLRRALDEVVRPAAAALLGASSLPASAAAGSLSASFAAEAARSAGLDPSDVLA
ncbi:hypothetical protein WME79_34880 [Sorangium sp. So ce726]|uniref:hypothetical protein n=1 Tax=Sorangium sp. So ce726 TaxID=3133319 RepID=UPI003F607AD9